MAWLLPELETGPEPELKPLEPELLELELLELEVPELVEPELPELVEPELPELVEPELAELVEPELDVALVVWVEPGSARASAPAVTTLARPTVVVAVRTLFRPRSRSAMARRMPSCRALLM